jgi:hypothetical protein
LGDPAADELTHDQLEERIAARGRGVMRQLLQDHMDLRSICEPRRRDVIGTDRVAAGGSRRAIGGGFWPSTELEAGRRRLLAIYEPQRSPPRSPVPGTNASAQERAEAISTWNPHHNYHWLQGAQDGQPPASQLDATVSNVLVSHN